MVGGQLGLEQGLWVQMLVLDLACRAYNAHWDLLVPFILCRDNHKKPYKAFMWRKWVKLLDSEESLETGLAGKRKGEEL